MAPVVPPVPSAPPDPPTTQWGVWEKRINWIVTLVAILVSLAVALVEIARTPPVQVPPVAPQVLPAGAPVVPDVRPATVTDPVSFLGGMGHGALAVAGALVPVGCSAAQQNAWRAAGSRLGQCLARCGVAAADSAVTQWMSGETVDAAEVGWDALPCVVACAGQAGAILLAGVEQTYTGGDSLGATLSPAARLAAPLPPGTDPLEAACGPRDGPPRCVIVLRPVSVDP